MANTLLMPKATAVWLVDNTALTFDQIADFCDLHVLEVKGIADGDVAHGILGLDPITKGQLKRSEIEKAEADPEYRMQMSAPKVEIPEIARRKGPRYTPLSRRQDRPNAILWLLRNHPEMKDSEIIKLVGTTKPTIQAIRERTHWNSANLVAADPVGLGLSTQIELDAVVQKAGERLERQRLAEEKAAGITGDSPTLAPTEPAEPIPQTAAENRLDRAEPQSPTKDEAEPVAADVFAKLGDKADAGQAESPASESGEDEAAPDADSVFAKLQNLKSELEDAESESEKTE